jgi:alkyl hydroperoxide reductase subunit AhpF
MELLSEQQRQLLRERLHDLSNPVTLLYYTPDVASAATRAERMLLEEVARASDLLHLEILADRWDAAREDAVGIARTPAIVLRADEDFGIRYYGAPDGYELEAFVGVIRAVSEGRSALSEASRTRVRQVVAPLHIEVLIAPT